MPVVVGLPLAVVSVELVDGLEFGRALRARVAQPPFAEHPRLVPCRFQQLEDLVGVRRNRLLPLAPSVALERGTVGVRTVIFQIAPYGGMPRMQARDQRGPRRSAYGAAGIVLREDHAVRRERVDIGRVDHPLAVAAHVRIMAPAQIEITEIVRQDEDHVRSPAYGLRIFLRSAAMSPRAENSATGGDRHQSDTEQMIQLHLLFF